ncbi:hypothetical protein GCM10025792_50420 [Pseudonocardia tropica]
MVIATEIVVASKPVSDPSRRMTRGAGGADAGAAVEVVTGSLLASRRRPRGRSGARRRWDRTAAQAHHTLAPSHEAPEQRAPVGTRTGGRSSDSRAHCSDLLAVASREELPVLLTAVVPAHRCGAVPDSHRVPSCLTGPCGPVNHQRPGHYIWGPDTIDPPIGSGFADR